MENIWFYLILVLIGAFVLRRLYEFPMPAFLSFLPESRLRKKVQPVKEIIRISGIKKGDRVLDLGCGSGTYTIDFARAVGKNGKVYAVDIQKGMIKKAERKLQKPENRDINNVELRIADARKLPFPDNFFDAVFLISVLPEIRQKDKALKEVRRVLKESGVLVIGETILDMDYPLSINTRRCCRRASFKLNRSWSNFFSYCLQFKKR